MGFRLLRVSPAGLAMIVGAGVVLGLGLGRLFHWPAPPSSVVGVMVLWLVLRAFDRRAWRRSSVVIRVDRNRTKLERLATDLRGAGFDVAVSTEPAGIRCTGKIHAKVVAAIKERPG